MVLVGLAGCSPSKDGGDGKRATAHVVTQLGIPAVGALYFVHSADGELLETGDTEDGSVTVPVEGGEMVTAFYAFVTDIGLTLVSVYTIADVQPGDELYFPVESFSVIGSNEDRGVVTLALSGTSAAGADGYGYSLGGCPGTTRTTFDAGGSEDTVVPADCTGNAFEPYAFAGLQVPISAFELLPSTPVAELFSNGGAAFTGAWRTDFDTVAYDLTNIPANAYNFVVTHRIYDDDGRRLFSNGAAAALQGVTSTSGEFVAIPFSTADFTQSVTAANSTAGVISVVTSGNPVDSSLLAIDFAAIPSYLTSSTIAAVDGRLEISWSGTPTTSDLLELSASYGVAENRVLIWRFRLEPGTPAPFRFPEWPSEIDGDAPPESADLVDLGTVRFTNGEWSSWDEVRQDDPRDDLRTSNRRAVERRIE